MVRTDALVMDELDEAACLALLASGGIGRVAVPVPGDGPLVVPVNYVVRGRQVLFRSGYGTKLRMLPATRLSFQVDQWDAAARTGWSVLARGRAREVPKHSLDGPQPEPWIPHDKPYLIALEIKRITGRRIRPRRAPSAPRSVERFS
jgi:uncharacterized protein